MSAKKYLKMPAQQPAQPAAKTEKEEQLWNALKRHIMRERERKKQGTFALDQNRIDSIHM